VFFRNKIETMVHLVGFTIENGTYGFLNGCGRTAVQCCCPISLAVYSAILLFIHLLNTVNYKLLAYLM